MILRRTEELDEAKEMLSVPFMAAMDALVDDNRKKINDMAAYILGIPEHETSDIISELTVKWLREPSINAGKTPPGML